jgi:hypothetical protein
LQGQQDQSAACIKQFNHPLAPLQKQYNILMQRSNLAQCHGFDCRAIILFSMRAGNMTVATCHEALSMAIQ